MVEPAEHFVHQRGLIEVARGGNADRLTKAELIEFAGTRKQAGRIRFICNHQYIRVVLAENLSYFFIQRSNPLTNVHDKQNQIRSADGVFDLVYNLRTQIVVVNNSIATRVEQLHISVIIPI